MKSYSESYKKAGVDVTAGYRAVDLMKKHIARTMTDNVLTGIGGFGGLYELDVTGMEHPVLVSGKGCRNCFRCGRRLRTGWLCTGWRRNR